MFGHVKWKVFYWKFIQIREESRQNTRVEA